MNTVTTYKHCAVKNGVTIEGSKTEIIATIAPFTLNNRLLKANIIGYTPQTYHSYNNEWSFEEMHKDAIKFLFNQLPKYGYSMYRNIGW